MSAIFYANEVTTGDCLDFTDVVYDRDVNGIAHPVEGFVEALSANGKFHVATVLQTKFRKNSRTKIVLDINGEKFNLTLDDDVQLRVLNDNEE